MELSGAGRGPTLQDLLDLVNTPSRSVQFVTQELVGRAGGSAKTAMDTGAQDSVSLSAFGCL